MDDLSAAALAAAASTALIQAMAADAWPALKRRAARIISRDDPDATTRLSQAMDVSRGQIMTSADDNQTQIRAVETARWAGRLEAQLDQDPAFAHAVRELLAMVSSAGVGFDQQAVVRQHVVAGRDAYTAGRDLSVGTPADRAP
ncbi:hypothetical protein [Micromonospora zhanjiangensis]|uniref:Uncharacterized protein n=1 Tax=Micromonospora zhanjiangensis TaxID=1522057 RepID=A0ABV8KT65_9ACTN